LYFYSQCLDVIVSHRCCIQMLLFFIPFVVFYLSLKIFDEQNYVCIFVVARYYLMFKLKIFYFQYYCSHTDSEICLKVVNLIQYSIYRIFFKCGRPRSARTSVSQHHKGRRAHLQSRGSSRHPRKSTGNWANDGDCKKFRCTVGWLSRRP